MKRQSGAVILVTVSALLIAMLMMLMGAYRSLWYQIKRANNEIQSRQAHWIAEGGLECAYFQVIEGVVALPVSSAVSVSGCKAQVTIEKRDDEQYRVVSTYDNITLNKTIAQVNSVLNAMIKTSAAVELTGSMHVIPYAQGDPLSSQCTSIISGGAVQYIASPSGTDEHFFTVDSTESAHATGPFGAANFVCQPTHKSNLYDSLRAPSLAGLGPYKGADIEENVLGISAFRDLFGMTYNAANAAKLKSDIAHDPQGAVFDGSNVDYSPQGWVHHCHTQLHDAYLAGKRRFWVEGNCAIEGNIFGSYSQPVDNAVQLIIHRGLLYSKGLSIFDGLIYQYLPSESDFDVLEKWRDLHQSRAQIGVTPLSFQAHDVDERFEQYSWLLDSALYLDGAIGVDALGRTIKLNGSLIPAYNQQKSQKHTARLEWLGGSWHD
ncbi:hypothetical protein BS333_03100 [Vibrio azureus]|uniref:Uncharacterized protein n=1 Tax=Vibrio azureus NBRC 104587 TaxID=1219077 RepID=U3ANV7_9VIBR|nr:hypothetical protein [Vibrio azureus]AUI85447.1 hypothetical protein BS333_03100 [Vibrio azureus]GAD75460.1 hypothetical protein VAZ01S_025_00550 [Vibrio azureus NBRC 104587]